MKASWSKVRIGWERDPFGGPVENFDEMRSRARNDRRIAQGGGERAKREAKADEANLAEAAREETPLAVLLHLQNQTQKQLHFRDHTDRLGLHLFERGTENELGRQQFTSDEHIGPGKTKELTVTITSPPTRTVSVTSLNLEEHDRFTEKIVLVRVKYADGRVWQGACNHKEAQNAQAGLSLVLFVPLCGKTSMRAHTSAWTGVNAACARQTRHRNTERRTTHVVETDLIAESDRLGSPPCSPQMPTFKPGFAARPRSVPMRTSWPTPSRSST